MADSEDPHVIKRDTLDASFIDADHNTRFVSVVQEIRRREIGLCVDVCINKRHQKVFLDENTARAMARVMTRLTEKVDG